MTKLKTFLPLLALVAAGGGVMAARNDEKDATAGSSSGL